VSLRRLTAAAAAMAALAAALSALSPRPADLVAALVAPQATVDISGPDSVVLAGCAALAWLVWSWGTLGLGLTAAAALPGVLGTMAGAALRVLLPASARGAAAAALGVTLGLGSPWVAAAIPAVPPAPAAAPVPDWPSAGDRADPVPDWPTTRPPAGAHVVVRGDCLWRIAESRVADAAGRSPTDREVLDAVQAWWSANAEVIGPDPDLLLPGQVLRPPETP
jgi:nucleoid-associated protein YgaU